LYFLRWNIFAVQSAIIIFDNQIVVIAKLQPFCQNLQAAIADWMMQPRIRDGILNSFDITPDATGICLDRLFSGTRYIKRQQIEIHSTPMSGLSLPNKS